MKTRIIYSISLFLIIAIQIISVRPLLAMESLNNTGSVTGKVTNAVNNQPIEGALVQIGSLQATSNAQGIYRIENVPEGATRLTFSANRTSGPAPLQTQFTSNITEGYHTITVSANNFATFTSGGLVVISGTETVYDLSLSPLLTDAELRFVLNWGSTPRDLDSHMKTPSGAHVYYSSRGSATAEPYVLLDYDVTTGFGPETITVYRLSQGVYHYYIYNYTGSPSITTSQAVVQIYNRNGTVATLEVPQTGEGRYWYVATIDGSNGRVNIVNRIQTNAPESTSKELATDKQIANTAPQNNEWSYLWDFGDNTSSVEANPSHTYTVNGLYTVTLTATKNSASIQTIEDSYILVAGSGSGVVRGKVTNATNNQAIAGAVVSLAGQQTTTDALGNYRFENVNEAAVQVSFTSDHNQAMTHQSIQFTSLLRSGYHTIAVSAEGFSNFSYPSLIVLANTENVHDMAISPILTDADIRFVLNWGANPRDLDSHMRTPSGYHIYYSNRGSSTSDPYVLLDYDVTSGFGPETITIYRLSPGTYHYYIYNYTGTPAITESQAVVQIYNRTGTVATLEVPQTGTGRYWYVATLDGSTGRVQLVNRIQTDHPGTSSSEIAAIEEIPNETQSGWTYIWDFGDGNFSYERNPIYAYNTPGTYSVNLIAQNGDFTVEFSQDNFIEIVHNTSITNEQVRSFQLLGNYPNPFNPGTTIQYEIPESSPVVIEIFNSLGQILSHNAYPIVEAGVQSVSVNAVSWPTGVYFYTVKFRGQILTGKMTLIK
jgi:uncharacterized protein YfaP (DUF2135 family)/PKD repeat protein